MSGKIKLGKTRDSRTRKKAKTQDAEAVLQLQQELKEQTEFTNYLLTKGFSTSTVQRYFIDTKYFLQWCEKENVPIENVSYADVLHYIQGKRKKVKQKTISIELNSLKHYFNFLTTTGQVEENPTAQIQIKGIKRKTLYDLLKKTELESLYNNFELPKEDDPNKNQNWFKTAVLAVKRNKVIVGLMVYQGLTVCELGTLTEKDIKLREGKVFVAGSRRSEERTLTLEAHQILDIMEYQLKTRTEILQQTGKQSSSFFVSAGSSGYFNSIMQKLMQKLHKQNSKVTSAKQIRTSVITHWLKLHNLRQAQYMAGHRFVSSTEAYLINDLDDLLEDVNKFHPLN